MSTTTTTPQPIDLAALERAVSDIPGPEGATFELVVDEYARLTGADFTHSQLTAALRELVTGGRVSRSKGPRGENVYAPAQTEEDPLERLQREKRQLQQALGSLTASVTFATARLDQHQRREDQWRELLAANDEAKLVLEATS